MTNTTQDITPMKAARIAGALYLITMATAIFGESFIRGSLIAGGNATQTALNIMESESLFRIGIIADLVTYCGVIALIWALYVLLKPVNKNLALLALLMRVVEVACCYTTTLFSLIALKFLSGANYLSTFDTNQLHSLARMAISAQGNGLNFGFILLGLGSTVFAYLLLKSAYIPKILAGWGVFSSLLLSLSALMLIAFPAIGSYQLYMMVPMFFYEVILGFWLLFKGIKFG